MKRFLNTLALLLLLTAALPPSARAAETENDTDEEESTKLKCDKPVVLIGDVDEEMLSEIFKTLIPCLEQHKKQMLVLNSTGGEALSSFGIFEAIRIADTDSNLTVRIHGQASSAMVIIALAADHREIGCYSQFFLHQVKTVGVVSASEVELDLLSKRNGQTTERYKKIILARTRINPTMLDDYMLKETVLLAEQATELGFATKIVGCD